MIRIACIAAALFAGLVALSSLSACATISKGQCMAGDWSGAGLRDGRDGLSRVGAVAEECAKHGGAPDPAGYERGRLRGAFERCTGGGPIDTWATIGLRDGRSGGRPEQMTAYAGACGQQGVATDPLAYEDGRLKGVLEYCTPTGGFRAGMRNVAYTGVCPARLEADFRRGHADGLLVHGPMSRRDAAGGAETTARNNASELERQIKGQEALIADPKTPIAEVDAARERLKRLRADRERALNEAERRAAEKADAERELGYLRARFTPIYGAGW